MAIPMRHHEFIVHSVCFTDTGVLTAVGKCKVHAFDCHVNCIPKHCSSSHHTLGWSFKFQT